jgi:6-phosphogluconate dehydrogenase (decarboxylating)
LFIDVESGKVVNVAVIGLGEMGGAVSSNLAAAGHAVAVFDLQQALVDEAVTDGSLAAASVSDAVRGASSSPTHRRGRWCSATTPNRARSL